MSTAAEYSIKETVFPPVCPHCHKASGNPPAWMKLLAATAPGRGMAEQAFSVTVLAKLTKLSRQRANILVHEAVKAGALEIPSGISGARVYRRTQYGRQILGRWKSLGWKGA